MTVIGYLLPIALLCGLIALGAFFWSLKSGQFDDMDGAALRIFIDDEAESGSEQPPQRP